MRVAIRSFYASAHLQDALDSLLEGLAVLVGFWDEFVACCACYVGCG
jgi:hypothetical protein